MTSLLLRKARAASTVPAFPTTEAEKAAAAANRRAVSFSGAGRVAGKPGRPGIFVDERRTAPPPRGITVGSRGSRSGAAPVQNPTQRELQPAIRQDATRELGTSTQGPSGETGSLAS